MKMSCDFLNDEQHPARFRIEFRDWSSSPWYGGPRPVRDMHMVWDLQLGQRQGHLLSGQHRNYLDNIEMTIDDTIVRN